MSQPPYGPPGQSPPPYPQQQPPQQQYPPYQQPQYQQGPQPFGQPQYGAPQYGPPGPPGPPQGPGFGWGAGFAPPPRKKSKAPLVVILSLVGVAIVGAWIFGVIKKNADNDYTPPVSSGSYSPEPTEPTEPSDSPTEEPTTNEPTEEPSSSTTTTSPPQGPSDSAIVANNRIYKVGQMRTVNCKEPKVRPTNNRNAAAYWAAIKPCLDRAWAPMVAKAGYRFRAPAMTYWAGTTVTNPCGSGTWDVPFYCGSNHMMYMKVDNFVKVYTQYNDPENRAYARMWYSRSIAHEYGHSVQMMTGIMEASSNIRYEQESYEDRVRVTRRLELQANCFAGVFLAANKRSYPINGMMLYVWNKWVVTSGDKPEEGDHGSVASQGRFMGKSFKTGNPASCNTYAASARNVS